MEHLDVESIAVVVTCTLSIFGSLFIIVSFALFKDFQSSQSRRLLVILSFCDLITAIAYLIRVGNYEPGQSTACHAQAALNVFANQASFFWTDFIALFVFLSRKYGMKYASRFIPFFHFLSWGWPIISVALVGSFGMWGYDNGAATADWCWIKGNQNFYWHIIAGKGVEWASCVLITIIYIGVFLDLRKAADQQQLLLTPRGGTTWKITEKKLLAIPFIFIILRLPGTIRTVYLMVHPNHPITYQWLAVMQAIGDSGQGLANGLLFGVFTEKVRSYYYKLLNRCTNKDFDDKPVNDGTAGAYPKTSHPYF